MARILEHPEARRDAALFQGGETTNWWYPAMEHQQFVLRRNGQLMTMMLSNNSDIINGTMVDIMIVGGNTQR